MSPFIRPLLTVVTAAVLCTAPAGCSGPESEEDHHLEHVIPEHKPDDFADAVGELESRWTSLGDKPAGTERLQELTDIVDWLPELAADSDLKRAQWEQVQQTTQQLSGIIGRLQTGTATAADRVAWAQAVAGLQQLVPDADALRRAVSRTAKVPDHADHDHQPGPDGDAPIPPAETEQ